MDLETLRKSIDRIDGEIVSLLAERYAVVKKIGEEKKRLGLPARVPEREAALLAKLKEQSRQTGLPPEIVESVYCAIMDCAVRLESEEE